MSLWFLTGHSNPVGELAFGKQRLKLPALVGICDGVTDGSGPKPPFCDESPGSQLSQRASPSASAAQVMVLIPTLESEVTDPCGGSPAPPQVSDKISNVSM